MNRNLLRAIPTALCILIAVSPIACKKREAPAPPMMVEPTALPLPTPAPAVTVTDVSLGKSLGTDKKVAAAMDSFKPRDTVFAVVQTDGTASASVINAKWSYQDGQVVKEDSRTIVMAGPATTEFSIQKPNGWPTGDYKVEIVVDGQPAIVKTFKVQ